MLVAARVSMRQESEPRAGYAPPAAHEVKSRFAQVVPNPWVAGRTSPIK